MRTRIARAAYEVIAERGHSGFRTAAVLAHSGVSQGALLHHFPTKDSLTLAAIAYALDRDRFDGAGEPFSGSDRDALTAMGQAFRRFFLGDRFWVALDITMDAAKNVAVAPEIRKIVREARGPVYDQWIDILQGCGWSHDRARRGVTMTAALVSGYAVRTLWTDDGDLLDTVLNDLFDSLLANSD